MRVTEKFQFGRIRPSDSVLLKYSKIAKGRPDFDLMERAKNLGYNYLWIFRKIPGQPQLVDGIVLSRKRISKLEKPSGFNGSGKDA